LEENGKKYILYTFFDDMKNTISTFQAHQEGEREKLESRLFGHIEKISAAKDSLIVRFLSV
jgi:hypothetical protein